MGTHAHMTRDEQRRKLSARDERIAKMLAQRLDTGVIAQRLGVTPSVVTRRARALGWTPDTKTPGCWLRDHEESTSTGDA